MNLLPMPLTYSAEDLLTLPDGDRYELVDGKLVELHMGMESSYIGGRLYRLLAVFCENPFLGWVLPADTSFQLLPDRPNLVRKPDVSFIRLGRIPGETPFKGHVRLAPDLAVEVVSPNDLYYEVEEKLAEYRAAGVALVWIVIPPTRTVLIRRLDGSADEVDEKGELDGEQVVPGFRCRVAELFHPPLPSASPSPSGPSS
jgi:Uma2 family endonuclease